MLFVDAGYVLAEGAQAVHGTRNRDSVSWDYAGLLKLFGGLSRDRTGLPLLRCYWYDISPDGNRTDGHDSIADIPGVKLRLAKIRPSRKEGVEAEIRKDLTALARNHAVSDVVIVSAEEDLAPVIAEVQDLGMRAILLTIATDDAFAASRALRQECDDLIEISPGHLRPYVDLISGAEPRLAAGRYRELAVDGSQPAEQHPAIEAPAQQLYASQLQPMYEGAPEAQLAGLSGHREQRDPAHGRGQDDPVQQPARTRQYQHAEGGRELLTASADQDFRATGYPVHESGASQLGAPGQGRLAGNGVPQGRDSAPAGQPDNGLAAAMPPAAGVPENGLSGNGYAAQGGHVANGYAGNGMPGAGGHGGGQAALQPHGLPANGLPGGGGLGGGQPDRGPSNGLPAGGMQGPYYSQGSGPQPGSYQGGGQDAGGLPAGLGTGAPQPGMQLPGGMGAGSVNNAGSGQSQQGGAGPGGQRQGGGLPQNGMSHQALGQFDGLQPQGQPMQSQSMPGQSARQPGGGPAHAAAQPGLPPQSPGSMQSPGSHSQQLPGQQLPGQGLPGSGQPGGMQRHGSSPGVPVSPVQNGLAPLESQRQMLPERQLPAGNGVQHYAAGGSAPYGGGSGQPAQFAELPSTAYGRGGYNGQPVPSSPGLSVGDAVQSAHAEGFGFGEAVARDAPALWLEAVLARKPRMPSDLEARLLQGSALPIDSLLHDEVRHALRRGFWDALERSRH